MAKTINYVWIEQFSFEFQKWSRIALFFALHRYVIGPENTSIRFKTKTNCDFLVTLVFLRFMHFACFYLRFSLHSSSWYFFSYASLAAAATCVTYDPNVSQDLIRPMIFFQSSKIQHLTCHRKVLDSNSHLEVRFPSFPTLTWHHFSSMALYFRASS